MFFQSSDSAKLKCQLASKFNEEYSKDHHYYKYDINFKTQEAISTAKFQIQTQQFFLKIETYRI